MSVGRAEAAHLNTSRWSSMTTFTSVLSSTQNSRYTYRGRSYHSVFAGCLGEEHTCGCHQRVPPPAFPGARQCSAGPSTGGESDEGALDTALPGRAPGLAVAAGLAPLRSLSRPARPWPVSRRARPACARCPLPDPAPLRLGGSCGVGPRPGTGHRAPCTGSGHSLSRPAVLTSPWRCRPRPALFRAGGAAAGRGARAERAGAANPRPRHRPGPLRAPGARSRCRRRAEPPGGALPHPSPAPGAKMAAAWPWRCR